MPHIVTFLEWSSPKILRENDNNNKKKVIAHLTHLEDLVITNGVDGADQAMEFVGGLIQYMAGHANAPVNVSVKVDGAPAIVVGNDPEDGKFFIGTKGAFSKDPKIAKSVDEIKLLYAEKPGLIDVMTVAFTALQPLRFPAVLQGDVMFTPALKRPQTIDGVSYITFKPNTIVYGVPIESELGQQIKIAKFGVCFHTKYSGSSLQSLVASPGVNVEQLRPTRDVVLFSSKYQDLSGTITFTKSDMSKLKDFESKLKVATSALRDNEFMQSLQTMSLLKSEFMVFQNSLVRGGETITLTPEIFVERFVESLKSRGDKEATKKTSDTGQASTRKKYQTLAKVVTTQEDALLALLEWQQLITQAKTFLLNKLNMPGKLQTFYDTTKGVVAGPHEGFVAADKMGNFVKLVDRSYFSKLNMLSGRFSKESV